MPEMYHNAPRDRRESLLAHGLDHTRGASGTDYGTVGHEAGNYLWATSDEAERDRQNAEEGSGRAFDTWAVDVTDSHLQPDPSWGGAHYTTSPIPPGRLREMTPVKMAMCPECDTPLIATFAFSAYEFYCLECGRKVTFFGPKSAEPAPELTAQYEALQAEWDEHAGPKLLTCGATRVDCAACDAGERHVAHATEAEREAHITALAWLHERAHGSSHA